MLSMTNLCGENWPVLDSHTDYKQAKSSIFGKVDGAQVSTAEDQFL